MFKIAFRGQGYVDTSNKLYNATNTDTEFQKTCACDYKPEYKVSYNQPYKTTKGAYSNISQKQKYAAFVRRTQDSSISKHDNIQFQFRNL
jgi:hypothetical protein